MSVAKKKRVVQSKENTKIALGLEWTDGRKEGRLISGMAFEGDMGIMFSKGKFTGKSREAYLDFNKGLMVETDWLAGVRHGLVVGSFKGLVVYRFEYVAGKMRKYEEWDPKTKGKVKEATYETGVDGKERCVLNTEWFPGGKMKAYCDGKRNYQASKGGVITYQKEEDGRVLIRNGKGDITRDGWQDSKFGKGFVGIDVDAKGVKTYWILDREVKYEDLMALYVAQEIQESL